MIPFDEIDSRLAALGLDRAWLAENTPYSADYIRTVLAPKSTRRTDRVMQILSDAIAQMESAKQQAKPPHTLILEFDDAQFDKIEDAAFEHGSTARAWARDVLNGAATMDVDAFVAEFFPDHAARLQPAATEPSVARFPVPLLRAAAGFPILADAEVIEHNRQLGEGRFLLELRGDSMEPRFRDRQRVVLRDRSTLKRPLLKYGQFYCFIHDGAACFKQWAKDKEGRKVLRSLNPDHADIPADDLTEWIGWFDPEDNA